MTTNQPSGPVGSTRPKEKELLAFGVAEQFMLFCDEDEFLQIANAVLDNYATRCVGLPDDFHTHKLSWRSAIDTLRKTAQDPDKGYWAHELRAFDRAYAELARMRKTQVVPEVAQAAAEGQAIESFEDCAIREFKVPSLDHLKDKVYSHAFVAAMELAWSAARRTGNLVVPIDMVLYCPKCHTQHVDAPEDEIDMQCNTNFVPGERWTNPPHRSHLCHHCGYVWRPADVPTNGVAAVKTAGSRDSSSTTKEQ